MCRHTKHFTRGFQWRVFRVNVHVCASKAPEECVHVCVCVGWRDRLFETWPEGPVGSMKGLFHVPPFFPIRCQAWIVPAPNQALPYAKYLLGYLRILNTALCEAGCVARMCYACQSNAGDPRQKIDTLSSCFSSFPLQISPRLIRARAESASP